MNYESRNNKKKELKSSCSYASQISIGDEVLVLESDEITPVKVINMSISPMQGKHHCGFLSSLY